MQSLFMVDLSQISLSDGDDGDGDGDSDDWRPIRVKELCKQRKSLSHGNG